MSKATVFGWLPLFSLGLVCTAADPAVADIITFSGAHGDVFYSDLDGDGTPDAGFDGTGLLPGVTVTVDNPNRSFDLGVIFDTTYGGSTTDDDLLGPAWTGGGNLAASSPTIGGIAIIQENTTGFLPGSNTSVSDPDDEGSRPAGTILFAFDTPIHSFGFDIVDVEGEVEAFSAIHLLSGGGMTTVPFSSFLTRDATVSFGNNSLNRIVPLTAAELGTGPWDSVAIQVGGSAGLDNVTFERVPEPSTLLLLGIGLAAVGVRRYRRKP